MINKFIILFFVSMVPIIELRGAMIMAAGWQLPMLQSLIICVVGNLIPVPFIYFFARKFLIWGANKRGIGKACRIFLDKGHKAGYRLQQKAGKGIYLALLLFVGIPLPGTGAWTGTLAASLLDMGFKRSVFAVFLGVILAGVIIGVLSSLGFAFLLGMG